MRRHIRGRGACTGMTDKEVQEVVIKKYSNFCTYRYELASHMPDYSKNLYKRRIFDGLYFDQAS